MNKIYSALGVESEGDAITAINASTRFVADVVSATGLADADEAIEQIKASAGAMSLLASVRELTGDGDTVATVAAWKASHERVVAVAQERDELKAELDAIRAEAAKADHAALVSELLEAGKLTESMRAWAESTPTETLRAYGEAVAPVVPGAGKPAVREATGSMSARAQEMTAMCGVDEKYVIQAMQANQQAMQAEENDE